MRHTWIRSHVQICLMDIRKNCRILADDDGDFPFRFKSAACYIRVEEDPPHLVRIFAVAASGVPRSAKLLTELNDVNSGSRTAPSMRHLWRTAASPSGQSRQISVGSSPLSTAAGRPSVRVPRSSTRTRSDLARHAAGG